MVTFQMNVKSKPAHVMRPKVEVTDKQRRLIGLGKPAKPVRYPSVTQPRETNAMSRDKYIPSSDGTFYRNDGHKHIKSKGFPC